MSGWAAYLVEVGYVSDGSAIVSLQGAECGKHGNWKATAAESQKYASLIQNIGTAQAQGLTYAGKKFIIVRAVDDTITAQLGKEGLVIIKANTVLVVAHTVEGQVLAAASAKVGKVVDQLKANGC